MSPGADFPMMSLLVAELTCCGLLLNTLLLGLCVCPCEACVSIDYGYALRGAPIAQRPVADERALRKTAVHVPYG